MMVFEQKQALRREMRAALAALSPAARAERSAQACAALIALPAFCSAQMVLAYKAMPTECDPAAAARAALGAGKRVAYPLCLPGNRLALYEPLSDNSFAVGKYGILEPVPERCRAVRPGEIDFAIIPGVAFGRDRTRLGHGAGYYDRLLEELPGVKAGLAFDIQLFDAVPVGGLDVKMDIIATNLGIIA